MATQANDDGPAIGGSISYSKVLDLSWPVNAAMPLWPGDPNIEFDTVADLESSGYFLRRFSMGEHAGTHLSAPAGFFAGAPGHESFSPQDLVRPAIVIDVTAKAQDDRDYALSMNDVLDWESDHGPVPHGGVALLRTGWETKWTSPQEYLGGTVAKGLHFPGFGLDAARLLLEGRGAAGFGVDTAGVEPGNETGFPVTRFALKQRRIVLENLAGLGRMPANGALLVIGLLRLDGGSGGPAAVTALVP